MAAIVTPFRHEPTGSWSYLLRDSDGIAAAIIDPVLDYDPASARVAHACAQAMLDAVERDGLRVDWLLETHAHADHLTAADWLRARLRERGAGTPKLGIGVGIAEVRRTFAKTLALRDEGTRGARFDHLFVEGEVFRIGNLRARVIATPGHTSDSVSYLIEDALFVGDTLFAPDVGTARCDFPGGDAGTLYRSIQRLYTLPGDTRVFLCHDYPPAGRNALAQTSIAAERASNIHLRGDTPEADYVALRERRDATLSPPKLLWPALHVNLRAGRLPPQQQDGSIVFKTLAAAAP
ncbi:MAG: MBL fold metallo-hydrolase [Rhodanobacteraceae bacterium]